MKLTKHTVPQARNYQCDKCGQIVQANKRFQEDDGTIYEENTYLKSGNKHIIMKESLIEKIDYEWHYFLHTALQSPLSLVFLLMCFGVIIISRLGI